MSNPWREWWEAHTDQIPTLPERIRKMHRVYKTTEGKTCKTCKHLLRDRYHKKTYLKCELYKITHGAGTDWRAKWPACGKYEEETKEVYICIFCGNQELLFSSLYPNGALCSVCKNSNRMKRVPNEKEG